MLQQNKLSDAEVVIQKIIFRSKGERIPRLHNMFGMLYTRKNMLEDAKREFHKEIDLNLGKEEAYFQLGMVYYQSQKTDSALYCWEEALKINPSNVDAMSNAAVVYFNVKKDVTKAKQLWENAVSLNPKYFQVYVNLMMLCQNKNDDECKLTYLRAALINGMQLGEIRSKGIVVTDQLLARVKQ